MSQSSASGISKEEEEEQAAQDLENNKERQENLRPTSTHHSLHQTNTNVSIAETLSLPRECMFVACICLAQFMTQASLGQTLAILHIIGDAFGLSDPAELSWLIAGYSLTVGTFILVAGRFGDVFGYKRMFMIGFAWFGLWSMIAGLAVYSNHVLFVFARVFTGIGPAICLPNGLAILGATYAPGPRKNMVFAMFGACAPGGSIVGAAFAGLFSLAWWPWTFWSFAIACFAIVGIGSLVIPDPPRKITQKWNTLRELAIELDLFGGLIGIIGLVLFNFAWNQAPIVGWQKAYVYVTLILGVLFILAFFYIELRVASAPLIPFSALNSDVSFVLICIACGWGCFGIWIYYTWQFLELLRYDTPLLATAQFAPVAISGALASVTTGFILAKVRPAVVMIIAMTCFTIGVILIGTAPVGQTYWAQTFVCIVVIPWGMDMSFPAATVILSNAVKKEHQGIGASLVNTLVNYSISIALGFAGTVEVHVNNGGETDSDELKGFRGAWYMAMGLAGLGLATSILFLFKGLWTDRQMARKRVAAAA